MKKLLDSVISLGKAALRSRPAGHSLRRVRGGTLIIMGNGPSLRQTIADNAATLKATDTAAVNFAANTPEFFTLKPRHYILADPHFFESRGADPNVELLWRNLARADWPLTIHIPAGRNPGFTSPRPNIDIQRFNMTPAEGSDSVSHFLFRRNLAMPRPRNVLVPAIMEGIRDGYDDIYIVGADHSWPHTLFVDDRNRVVTVQPHYYEDNRKELDRVAEAYKGIHIHDVLGSMATAFRSYHAVNRYAKTRGARIINSTPSSLIDAFPRGSLPLLHGKRSDARAGESS